MTTRDKGRMAENEYKALLENDGWIMERVKSGGKFAKQVDFFGIGDLIGFNPLTRLWIIVQVKCNQTRGAIKQLKRWCYENTPPHCLVVLAVRYDNKPAEKRWKEYEIQRGVVYGREGNQEEDQSPS